MTAELWVFGYGSLMWRPGFPYDRRVRARLTGLTRRLCVMSVHHRGTERRPGLVLGLDVGGDCDGIAYRVPSEHVAATQRYLKAREQVNGVYREAHVRIEISAEDEIRTRTPRALTYIAERAHPSYLGALPLAEQARIVMGARGLSGHNVAYVMNTVAHLRELGIRDRALERLAAVLGPIHARSCALKSATALDRGLRSVLPRPLPDRLRHRPLRTDERRRFGHRQQIDF